MSEQRSLNKDLAERKSRSAESFFGRRKGQKLEGRKQRLTEELLPQLLLNPAGEPLEVIENIFPNSPKQIRLEIGFGGGEHLAAEAQRLRDTGFIGVEPFINGMAKMLGEIDTHDLKNVRLYNDDATRLLDWLPAASIDRVDLLYPDPWPKKRHWKRRFVNTKNLDRIARVLKPDGEFRFASDIDTYVNWTLRHCRNNANFEWTAISPDDWCEPWPHWLRTRYEAKAIREGRSPCYLIYNRT